MSEGTGIGGVAKVPARVGTELDKRFRWVSVGVGTAALIYAGVLAWLGKADGIGLASILAVAAFTLIFGLAGVVPASIKVGDVELALQQAKEEGEEKGKESGAVAGLKAAAALTEYDHDDLEARLSTGLATAAPVPLDGFEISELRVPNLGPDGEALARKLAKKLAKH